MLRLQLCGPMSDRIIYEDDGTENTLFRGTLDHDAPGFVALWQAFHNWNLVHEDAQPAPQSWPPSCLNCGTNLSSAFVSNQLRRYVHYWCDACDFEYDGPEEDTDER